MTWVDAWDSDWYRAAEAPMPETPPVPPSWTPAALNPMLKLWLDAQDPNTILHDVAGIIPASLGDPVVRWLDRSEHQARLTPMGGIVKPTVQNGAISIHSSIFPRLPRYVDRNC